MGRTKSDEELEEILNGYSDEELYGLKFGMLPYDKTPKDLSGEDVARLMRLNPKGHY